MPTTRAVAEALAQRCTSTPSPQPTSSSDRRRGLLEQLVERALEAGHQAPHDRVGGAVLVVGVAGDDAVLGDRHAAHRRTASRSSQPRLDALRAARRVAGARPLAARFVVRGLDAELQLDAAHALEGALGHHPLGGQQVADHAQRPQHDRRDEQHRAEDQRLHVALAVAVDVGDGEADPDADRRPGRSAARGSRTPAAARTGRRCGRSRRRCGARRRPSTGTAATRGSSGWCGPGRGRSPTSCLPAWMIVSSV